MKQDLNVPDVGKDFQIEPLEIHTLVLIVNQKYRRKNPNNFWKKQYPRKKKICIAIFVMKNLKIQTKLNKT